MKKEFFVVQFTDMPQDVQDDYVASNPPNNDTFVRFYPFDDCEKLTILDKWIISQGYTVKMEQELNLLVEIAY